MPSYVSGLTLNARVFVLNKRYVPDRSTGLFDCGREFHRLFATKAVTPELLNSSLNEIGSLQAKVRAAHLEAHLTQFGILTPEQNARYSKLRGYGSTGAKTNHGGQHKH